MTKVKFNENSTLTGTAWLHQFLDRSESVVAVVEVIEINRVVGPLSGRDLDTKYIKGQIIVVPATSIDVCIS